MKSRNFWLSKEVLIGVVFGLLVAVPVFVFGSSKTAYVDKNANGTEDGSSAHPYHSISNALDHVKDGTEVFVASGHYKENITLPKGVTLIGKEKDNGAVVIEAKNDKKPTISMKHQSEIDHITVVGGQYGVRVLEKAKVIIYDAVIEKSNRDGIYIESASLDKKYQVSISNTTVRKSNRAGINAEKRIISIVDSNIAANGSDGIDFAAGTKAWLESSSFSGNKGSGAKFVLDGSSVQGKKNNIRNNSREGVEINSYGAQGAVSFKKTTIIKNGRYGVARVARTASGFNAFGGVEYGTGVNASRIEQNTSGSISGIVRGF